MRRAGHRAFLSSDGGATEDAANVWGGDYPYLKGKIDPYEEYDSSWSDPHRGEVQKKLISAGYTIGTVANVEVTKRTATDNVNEVTVTDTAGKQVTIEKDEVRTVFGLDSIRYTITPNTSSAAAALPQRASLKISPSTHKVTADGKPVEPQGYNINDNNYYKLRDIAYILNGTDSQFNVAWDGRNNRIELTKGAAYQTVGGEMAASGTTAVESCTPSDSTILLDGKEISLTGYRVNGNNYYKVRDIGEALGFSVGYENETVLIRTTETRKSRLPLRMPRAIRFRAWPATAVHEPGAPMRWPSRALTMKKYSNLFYRRFRCRINAEQTVKEESSMGAPRGRPCFYDEKAIFILIFRSG